MEDTKHDINIAAALRWRLPPLAKRRPTMAVLSGQLEDTPIRAARRLYDVTAPNTSAAKHIAAGIALAALLSSPAFAGGSGLEIEAALTPFWNFFLLFLVPIVGIAALVFAGILFVAGGARAVGTVAVVLIGVALVAFAVPIAASRFGLAAGGLLW